ncbi:HAD family sugar phosphatase [Levilactobacillus koreensis JCM 16448]|uniref:Acid sugar phosphatase n=1 Tax=Levilactobacillus koreensis TaxID=637971 RepID=A0AAC8ZFV9_9LACO|nr:TIGR01457 family HAD-type hydrolase [Levilactobacillus koreensis]AKP63613.1 HAD family hydrolase [Levilactobacillus koreensis]KRK88948.1 HAD family sugar phosphatase [Levilactobacillus koreensis JCM 16448]
MKDYQAYLIDLDGTVYAGSKRYPAAKRFVERLQAAGTAFKFVTNNTTKLPVDVVANLADNHDIHVTTDNVYTAGLATADYLDQRAGDGERTVYVVGEIGLRQALMAKGFTVDEEHPRYVVVGLDSDVTYEKFAKAVLAIRSGSTFIGTNSDSNIPKARGLMPGAGALVDLVRYATQTQPIFVGKPEPIILQNSLAQLGIAPEDALMVGDNYQTDILAGIHADVDTLLVYTGVSTPEQVAQEPIQPTYTVSSLDRWDLEVGPRE